LEILYSGLDGEKRLILFKIEYSGFLFIFGVYDWDYLNFKENRDDKTVHTYMTVFEASG
jgi:DUF971 family protein